MPDLQRQINERVAAFVSDVTEIARQAAMDTLTEALHDGKPAPARRTATTGYTKPQAPARRGRGGKRSPEELDQMAEQLHAHIQENPGERMEEIARSVGSSTRDLALPVKKLLSDRRIRTEGQKRATRYYPASGGRGKARAKRKPGRPARKGRGARKAK